MINQSILRKVLIVGTALLLAASGSEADASSSPGHHYVVVKTSPGVQSILIWGFTPGMTLSIERPYPASPTPGWCSTPFMALNGTELDVATFTSPNCTGGYKARRVGIVPAKDGLQNVWVDASQPGFGPLIPPR